MNKKFTDIDGKALDELVQRVAEAKEHNLALSAEDCQLLLDALLTLANLHEKLACNDITIVKLRKLAGIVKSSEKLSDLVSGSSSSKNKSTKKNKPNQSNKAKTPPVKPEVKHHSLEDLNKGDDCPECETGKLYKYDPATLLRIVGNSPFKPIQHVMERLRCNTCGAYFTAPLPEEVLKDGEPEQKYGYSARSLMGINKFYAGLPYYRQGSLQDLLGVSITASTIFDQSEYLTNSINPVFKYIRNLAAGAKHYYIDDTGNRILEQKPITKKRRNGDKEQLRTGVYTSGMIATTTDNRRLILFETNIGHAGEFLDDILSGRAPHVEPPIIMSDALSRNWPTVTEFIKSLCNSHARRLYIDVLSHFPDEVEHVLKLYAQIWDNDKKVVALNLTEQARLAYHKEHSLPPMEEIRCWGQNKLKSDAVEENSGLGKAICYFEKHFESLTQFCKIIGAKIDNNLMEAQLKLPIRNRKNAGFYRTLTGACIGDVITSMIATTAESGNNAFDYFNFLQRNQEIVKANPEKYLPWNYLENQPSPQE